jgi:hypothetical protein
MLMNYVQLILDSLLVPEAGLFLACFIFFIFLWVILRKIKRLKKTMAVQEWGHLEWHYQSSEMRAWRLRLISTDRTNMKELHNHSGEVLHFFDRIGFLIQREILSKPEIWQSFGGPVLGYFSFLFPYIQWLRSEERDPDLYVYFEDLNEMVYRLNRKASRKEAHALMEEEELNRFIEEEKGTLSD